MEKKILKNQIWKTTHYAVTDKGELICLRLDRIGLTIEECLFFDFIINH